MSVPQKIIPSQPLIIKSSTELIAALGFSLELRSPLVIRQCLP
jgi:hypothetical protein